MKYFKFLLGFFPRKLPVGAKELETFCKDIFETYSIPDMPSYRQAIATMIMHIPPQTYHKSPWYFACSVRKAMANQIAYEMIDAAREEAKQKAAQDKAAEAQPIDLNPAESFVG